MDHALPVSLGLRLECRRPTRSKTDIALPESAIRLLGVKISTWGMSGLLTDAAIARYCDQCAGGDLYTVVSQDSLNQSTGRPRTDF